LSQHDSRATSLDAFKEYLRVRFRVQEALYAYYARPVHRIHRWWNWRDRRRSEDRFVQRVIETFGSDAVLAYGDWSSGYAMPGLAPTPTTGLRRRLAQKLHVVLVSEYRTSKTCSRCHGPAEADPTRTRLVKCRDDVVRSFPVRGIRRCNSDECGGRLRWDRDHNAAINIRANLLHAIHHDGRWHPSFARQQQEDACDNNDTKAFPLPQRNGGKWVARHPN
jgi:hypothetical protein